MWPAHAASCGARAEIARVGVDSSDAAHSSCLRLVLVAEARAASVERRKRNVSEDLPFLPALNLGPVLALF
jgi:hypothetical protein